MCVVFIGRGCATLRQWLARLVAAVANVIKRFGITRWVLRIGGCLGETAMLCTQVLAGERELVGGISLRALPNTEDAPRVRVFALTQSR